MKSARRYPGDTTPVATANRADSAPPSFSGSVSGGALPPPVSVHLNALLAKVKPS